MNSENDFHQLLDAVGSFPDLKFAGSDRNSEIIPAGIPETVMSVREALLHDSEYVNVSDSTGRISAEPVSLYPPGTALLFPGEHINGEYLKEKGLERIKVIKVR